MNSPAQPEALANVTNGASGRERVAIVGGGIAGLFCAYALKRLGYEVVVFESSEVLGGRIRSFRFNPELLDKLEDKRDEAREPIAQQAILPNALNASVDNPVILANYDKREWDQLEFNAEFGPMRIELDVQQMLGFLIKHLGIRALNEKPSEKEVIDDSYGLVHMQGFPPFSSPASKGDPVYDLRPEEEGKNPLELLKLGLCRAVVDLNFKKTSIEKDDVGRYESFLETRAELIEDLGKAAATQRPIMPLFEAWVRHQIHEDDLWIIQRYGRIPILYGAEDTDDIDLHTMGFWNLMAAYLSHNALAKVRDLGSFYHLIPENPNAGEWLTWWLRQISIGGDLQGIFGGMQSLVEKLVKKMGIEVADHDTPGKDIMEPLDSAESADGSVRIYRKATAVELTTAGSKVKVRVKDHEKACDETDFARVILALPTVPAEKLVQRSKLWPDNPTGEKLKDKLAYHLHSALPFSLLKVFFIVRDRWWEEPVRANPDVSRYPTREVYFWKSRIRDSRRGLIMLYTDRPAATFWANYVPTPTQEDIAELCLPAYTRSEVGPDEVSAMKTLRGRLKSRFVEYINEVQGKVVIKPEDIIWCGIMDWGREPYGAASHTWRPNRQYWNTLAALAEWPLGDAGAGPHLHVCGEAYSDYHAFIEGSLRSAVHVLTQVVSGSHGGPKGALKDVLFEALGVTDDVTDVIENGIAAAPASASDEDRQKWDSQKYVSDFHAWSNKLNELKGAAQKVD